MNNYCRNCGEKLDKNVTECPKCGEMIINKRVNVQEKQSQIENFQKKEEIYFVATIALYALFLISLYFSKKSSFFSLLGPLFFLSATILLIYSKINLKHSKIMNTLLNIIIFIVSLLILVSIIFYIYIMVTCFDIYSSCVG